MARRRRTKKNWRKMLIRYGGGFGLLIISIAFCLHTLQSPAKTTSDLSPLAVLSHFPVPEMPAQTVALVQAATADNKVSVLTNALWAVSGLARPGVMPYVISALCRANPDMADVVVATALEINNTPLVTVFNAAKAAAPDMSDKITIAAFRAEPGAFVEIAMALAGQAAESPTNVLRDLCAAVPGVQPFVDTAKIQAGQIVPDQFGQGATNQAVQELSVILSYTMFAITNSGQTVDELLTNEIDGANEGSPLGLSTNLNTNLSTP